ncbi:MAG TPA: tetratricopeptide repeat protein, partial [Micromonosporaceae bacterium]
AAATEQPTGVPIAAIWGTAGVGKTALAVHWAHRVAHHFPDGQLYVNLRGFDAESAVDPVRAIQGFLEALDVTPARMPADVTALSALYRSVLAGRRMLVVLDNARDAGQVRPLLPGAPGCVVLVTSRDQMLGLVAAEGAQVVLLDLLPVGDARTLLARRLGAARVEAELDAVDEIIERCARLPLALAIVASRAATSPRMRLDVLADHLRRAGPGLSAMSTGDVPVDVRVAFSWSYRQLTPGAARLFRLLGLHPGPHVSTVAVMSLAGIAADEVDAFLDELVGAQLLSEDPDGRYLFHDLLRAYAAEQAHAVDTPEQHRAALTRLFDRYLADAVAATELLAPTGTQIRPPHRAADGSTPVKGMPFTDAVCAVRWLDLERPNLVAVCRYVATRGWPDYAVRIAATLWRYLNRGGHYADAVTIHTDALHAARLTGDARTEADAMNYLGTAHSRHGRYREAADLLLRAHDAFGAIGDRTGEARTLTNLGVVYGRQGRYVQAAEVLGQALVRFRELDHPHGQALVLTNLGTVHERLGRYEEAVEQHGASLCLARTVGDRICEAHALNSLGLVYAKQGRYNEASEQLQASLAYCREMGDRVGVADALTNLGLVDMWRSRLPDALGQFQQALGLFRGAGDGYGEARVLNGLGEAMRIAGRTAAARAHHEAALAVTIGTGDQHEEARALAGLGDALVAAGDPAAARDHWRRAVGIYACLQAPEADAVRGRLAD